MCAQAINVELLPTTAAVASSLKKIFAQEDIDLRDVTAVALQDAVVFINIIFLVNKSFQDRDRPVVNTVQAAINLLGMPILKEKLLSLKSIEDINLSVEQKRAYAIVRNRIYVAANMTGFWADYMGEKNIEELYCASMFTGVNNLYQIIDSQETSGRNNCASYLDSIENIRGLYNFNSQCVPKLPDSIQQVYLHSSYSKRLVLSVLVYELVAALELGYATEDFAGKLKPLIEHIDQSASRATYDFAIQLVQLHRNAELLSFNHAVFLLSTNTTAIEPMTGDCR